MNMPQSEDQFDRYVQAIESLEKLDAQLDRWIGAVENFAAFEHRQLQRMDRLLAQPDAPHKLRRLREQRAASLERLAREIEHARSIRHRAIAAFR
jgi:hypothetical protein